MDGRRIRSASAVAVGVLAIMAADHALGSAVGFFGIWAAFALLSLHEFYAMAAAAGWRPYRLFGITAGTFTAVACGQLCDTVWLGVAAVGLLLTLAIDGRQRLAAKARLVDPRSILITLAGIVAIGFLGSYLTKVRLLYAGSESWRAEILVLIVIMIAKGGDIAAYFVGKRFGRHKLAPTISPNKTWEGAAGSLATSIGVAVVWSLVYPKDFLPLGPALIFGLVLGIVSPLGDLAESWFKRRMKASDSSSILPGYGGFLDVIDALLFAFPATYYLLPLLRTGC